MGQKWPLNPPRSLSSNMINTKMLSFWCPVMMVPKKNERCPQKLISGQKTSFFDPKRAILGNWGQKNGLLSGQTATYRKPKAIQSYLRMWGSYDPTESGLSEPKKGGLYWCSVKKNRFFGQKCCFLARNQFFGDVIQIF